MSDNAETRKSISDVIEWIDTILEKHRWTGTDLARKAGLAPSTVLRILNDPTHQFVPSMRTLRKMADASGVAIPKEIIDAPVDEHDRQSYPPRMPAGQQHMTSAAQAKVPVRYVSTLPAKLQQGRATESFVQELPQMAGDDTAFAFHMPDNLFGPVMPSGTLCYATKIRDPKEGDIALFVFGDGRALIRIVHGIDERGFTVEKPGAKPEIINFDDVAEVAIIVATYRA